jgi:voltage-gated potassium channel
MATRHRFLELFIQVLIVYSVVTHFIEVECNDTDRGNGFFFWSDVVVTLIFTVEYFVRWIASRSLWYPFRPIAIVDLLAILPLYVSFLVGGYVVDLRSLRLIRLFRVVRLFKMERHNHALQNLLNAFNRVRYEFMIVAFGAVVIGWCSSLAIYELERQAQPDKFGHLSDAVWYVLMTSTTGNAGGDAPITTGGKIVAVCTMIAGLMLFGTFISLIGSAFLEEIRQSLHVQQTGKAPGPDGEVPVPEALRAMTPQNFDPRQVLQGIDDGALNSARGLTHLETVRLLAIACRRLADDGNGKRVTREEYDRAAEKDGSLPRDTEGDR